MIQIRARLLFVLLAAAAIGFAQRGPAIEQQLAFAPYHASGIYDVGETVGWTVTPGPVKPTYAYKWAVRRNNAVVLKEGKLDLSSGNDKIEIAGDQPEMIYVAIEPYANLAADAPAAGYLGGNAGRNNRLYAVGAAVAPAKIGLSTPRPDDFDAFWEAKLAAQAKVPVNPVLTKVETDVPDVELNMFVLDALGSQTHGYLAKPAGKANFRHSSNCSTRACTP
jgi:cephalosporin-C deacetylase